MWVHREKDAEDGTTRHEEKSEFMDVVREDMPHQRGIWSIYRPCVTYGTTQYCHHTAVYARLRKNTGSFNPNTGIFTAPVRGLYYFSYSGHNHSSKSMGLQLMKNGRHITMVYNHPYGNRYETATKGTTLYLNVTDQVYMRLMKHNWIFDNNNYHSTFVGFLVSPL
ncbi:cerebellin-4-like [Thalassophryne amazonica]|uniref:cerebellin-4-like n=1 Tax=Thalassophryne amazonica TaxID=390379 RepID=UPI0014715538|nr:cerebellin-4-like [Thalassophryne amazonica]